MNQNDAQRILRNLDKIKHLANGGEFGYRGSDKYPWRTNKMVLQHLDHYHIIKREKPRFKLKLHPIVVLIEKPNE